MAYGYKTLNASSGVPLQLTYDGKPEWKGGSITIDWSTVTAVGSDTALAADQLTVPSGQKYLSIGQVMCKITATGLYGPYDPSVSDGRQTLARDSVGLMNRTVLQNGVLGFTVMDHDYGNLIVGGRVWAARVIQSGTATHTLAVGPTLAELLAVMPRLMMV